MQEVFNKLIKEGLSPNAFYVLYCIHNKVVPSDLVNASIEVTKLKSGNYLTESLELSGNSLKFIQEIKDQFPMNKIDLMLKEAFALKLLNKLDEGYEIIENLSDKYPNDNFILKNQVIWLHVLNKNNDAISLTEKLIEKNPKDGSLFDLLGEILMYQGTYEDALNQLNKALELDPFKWSNFQIYIKIGICYKEMGNKKTAKENLLKGEELIETCFCEISEKAKWNSIVNLYLGELDIEYA